MTNEQSAVAGEGVAIVVCTRNRPDDLRRCLESTLRSAPAPAQVIVTDDGDDFALTERIGRDYGAEVVRGPKLGLCANRNNALRHVRAPRVAFLDDDALLAPDFLRRTGEALAQVPPGERDRVIVTGREQRPGVPLTRARDQDFLGFQRRLYDDGEPMHTVVINAAVFPARLFDRTRFDERLRYGYDEVDLTTRAVANGYEIIELPEAVNEHRPSPGSRGDYAAVVHSSRLYVTFKRYAWTESRPLAAAGYAVAAPTHLLLALVRREGARGVHQWASASRTALRHVREHKRAAVSG